MVKIGCCGFPTAKENYFKKFKVVEIQQTFYQLPEEKTAERWRNQAPQDFEYTLKSWQLITHLPTSPTYKRLKLKIKNEKNYGFFKPTDEVFSAWDQTDRIAQILKSKIIVFQCPASFKADKENIKNLKSFFRRIKRRDYIFCWEPRGNWDRDTILNLCRELNLVHCVDPFQSESVYGEVRYYRLHGLKGYNYKYSDQDLSVLKKLVMQSSELITYMMFNNVYMFADALCFKELIDK
ncbi:MAG: DUF72 domain-containing protein [Candidatus Omnitrophica bacterium]|nr:DUF72 domain-containing protein [Candidatus Omnitrophota bacterium]MCM8794075.1 DUF72 domain-containing protein [Candidatus Omnitrophota bacterium]